MASLREPTAGPSGPTCSTAARPARLWGSWSGAWGAGCGRLPQPASRLPHAQGDAGRLEAGLLRREEDSPTFGWPESEARDAERVRAAGLRLDSGAHDSHPRVLDPGSAPILDRDADGAAPPLAQAALDGELHAGQQAELLSGREVAEIVVRVHPGNAPVRLVAAPV